MVKRIITLILISFVFVLNLYSQTFYNIKSLTIDTYKCASGDENCYYTDGFIMDNYLFAISDQYRVDLFSINGDKFTLIKQNLFNIHPEGKRIKYKNYLIISDSFKGGYIGIIDSSHPESSKLIKKIILPNNYYNVWSLACYNDKIYISTTETDSIYIGDFNQILSSGNDINLTDANYFKSVAISNQFYLLKNFLAVKWIGGSYRLYNLDTDPYLKTNPDLDFYIGGDVADMFSDGNYIVVQYTNYGYFTAFFKFEENNIQLIKTYKTNGKEPLYFINKLKEKLYYLLTANSDFTKEQLKIFNGKDVENLSNILTVEYSYSEEDYPGILMKLLSIDDTKVIAFYGSNGMRMLKLPLSSETSKSLPTNCSVFNAENFSFKLPCLKIENNFYTVEMKIINIHPEEILINITNYSNTDITNTKNCADFDFFSNELYIPCIKVGNDLLNLNMYLSGPGAKFKLKTFGYYSE